MKSRFFVILISLSAVITTMCDASDKSSSSTILSTVIKATVDNENMYGSQAIKSDFSSKYETLKSDENSQTYGNL